ncbi:MAG: cation transporter [Hyphomonas sp.]|nr:cation transporter [Hyphomonas sp.]
MEDHGSNPAGESAEPRAGQKRVLHIVLAINAVMFVVQFGAGVYARSSALMADATDMFGDAFVYVLSLVAIDRGPRWRAGAVLVKGLTIVAFGLFVIGEIVLKIIHGVTPSSSLMLIFGAISLAANSACLALLWRYPKLDVNMSSTFECSRNDVFANVGVLIAAAGVYALSSPWPDIAVGAVIAAVFFRSAFRVLSEAWPQYRAASTAAAE